MVTLCKHMQCRGEFPLPIVRGFDLSPFFFYNFPSSPHHQTHMYNSFTIFETWDISFRGFALLINLHRFTMQCCVLSRVLSDTKASFWFDGNTYLLVCPIEYNICFCVKIIWKHKIAFCHSFPILIIHHRGVECWIKVCIFFKLASMVSSWNLIDDFPQSQCKVWWTLL